MHKNLLSTLLVLGFVLAVADVSQAYAETPTEFVKAAAEDVQRVLDDNGISNDAKNKILEDVLRDRFDFYEMSKRVLGQHFAPNKDRMPEFTKLFVKLLGKSYLRFSAMDEAKGAKIIYLRERRDGDFAEVATKVVTKFGREIAVSYRLRRFGESWRIYDALVEGVSLISSYRAQFNKVILESSFEELLRRIREKVTEPDRR